MNPQVLAAPDGRLLPVSGCLPGSAHDLSAAWIWGLPRLLHVAELLMSADKCHQ